MMNPIRSGKVQLALGVALAAASAGATIWFITTFKVGALAALLIPSMGITVYMALGASFALSMGLITWGRYLNSVKVVPPSNPEPKKYTEDDFNDPISLGQIENPVKINNNYFDLGQLAIWMKTCRTQFKFPTNPRTNLPLPKDLVKDLESKKLISKEYQPEPEYLKALQEFKARSASR